MGTDLRPGQGGGGKGEETEREERETKQNRENREATFILLSTMLRACLYSDTSTIASLLSLY